MGKFKNNIIKNNSFVDILCFFAILKKNKLQGQATNLCITHKSINLYYFILF